LRSRSPNPSFGGWQPGPLARLLDHIETQIGGAATPSPKGMIVVVSNAESQRFEISEAKMAPSTGLSLPSFDFTRGGEREMLFSDWFEFVRLNWRKQEGQTMAEYGVVLAVITVLIVGALTALSGGIKGALNNVTSVL
jgi:Flp pilus assembly pilin Flp